MWWIIILIIGVIMLVKFFADLNKQANYVTKQGGMRTKYKQLLDYALASSPKARIIQETSTFINIGASSPGGAYAFMITHSFGSVIIQWKLESTVFGKHQLEWQFSEFDDQQKMIEQIENDLDKYQNNVIKKYM